MTKLGILLLIGLLLLSNNIYSQTLEESYERANEAAKAAKGKFKNLEDARKKGKLYDVELVNGEWEITDKSTSNSSSDVLKNNTRDNNNKGYYSSSNTLNTTRSKSTNTTRKEEETTNKEKDEDFARSHPYAVKNMKGNVGEKAKSNKLHGFKGLNNRTSQFKTIPNNQENTILISQETRDSRKETNSQYKYKRPTVENSFISDRNKVLEITLNYSSKKGLVARPIDKLWSQTTEKASEFSHLKAGYQRTYFSDYAVKEVMNVTTYSIRNSLKKDCYKLIISKGKMNLTDAENKILSEEYENDLTFKEQLQVMAEYVGQKMGIRLQAIENADWIIKNTTKLSSGVLGDASAVIKGDISFSELDRRFNERWGKLGFNANKQLKKNFRQK